MLVEVPEMMTDGKTLIPRHVLLEALRDTGFVPVRMNGEIVGNVSYHDEKHMDFEISDAALKKIGGKLRWLKFDDDDPKIDP